MPSSSGSRGAWVQKERESKSERENKEAEVP